RARHPPAGPDVPGPRLAHPHRPGRHERRADPGPAAPGRWLLVADRRARAGRRDDPGHPHRPRGSALPARRPSAAGGASRAPRPHRRRRRALRGAGRGAEPAAGPRPAAAGPGPALPRRRPAPAVAGSLRPGPRTGDDRRRRLRAPLPPPAGRHRGAALHHHRGRALLPAPALLNSFDGETFRGTAEGDAPAMGMPAFSDARDDGVPAHGSRDDLIDTDVQIISYAGDRLPVPDNVRSIQGADATLNRAMTLQPTGGEVALSHVRSGLLGQRYSIESEPPVATAEQLRNVDPAVFEQPFEAGYTSRDEVPETAAALADRVAENADADTGYDTAVAFQDYFRNSFAYSLTVNSPPGEDPLESFLEDRVGYCEQFAASFALMMISQGYPARVAIGFTPGQQDGDE